MDAAALVKDETASAVHLVLCVFALASPPVLGHVSGLLSRLASGIPGCSDAGDGNFRWAVTNRRLTAQASSWPNCDIAGPGSGSGLAWLRVLLRLVWYALPHGSLA